MVAKLLLTASTAPPILRSAAERSITSDMPASSVGLSPYQRPHLFPLQDAAQIAFFQYIEDDDGQVLAAAQRGRGVVHDGEVVGEQIHVVEAGQAHGLGIPSRVPVVDSIHLVLRHQERVGPYLQGAQGAARVGRKERVARTAAKNYNAPLLEVAYGAAPYVGLGDLLDLDGRLHPGLHAASLQR